MSKRQVQRTYIVTTKDLHQKVKELAKVRGVSMGALIRMIPFDSVERMGKPC